MRFKPSSLTTPSLVIGSDGIPGAVPIGWAPPLLRSEFEAEFEVTSSMASEATSTGEVLLELMAKSVLSIVWSSAVWLITYGKLLKNILWSLISLYMHNFKK